MTWGTKIAILYVSFVLLIITMVYMSMNQKIELVSNDYYVQELKYEEKIKRINKANELSSAPLLTKATNVVKLSLPKEMSGKQVKGSIVFFKPSDLTKDKTIQLACDTAGFQQIYTSEFAKGMYKVKIEWTCENESYFNEQMIVLD